MGKYVVLLGAVAAVALTARAPTPPLHPQDFRPLLLRPAFAQTLSKAFLPALVDLLWLRSLNAIGLKDTEQKNKALYEYGVVLSELDPRFHQVYEYIGLNIPIAVSRNVFVGGDLACDLFERGIKVFPKDVKLHMYLGFSLFHHQRKFSEASEVFARAARLPDALPWMAPLATRLKAHSGSAEDAVQMTQDMLAGELDDAVRGELEKRLEELHVEVVLQQVNRASKTFYDSFGRYPATVVELKQAGMYLGPLVDPSDGLISIEPDGKANSTSITRRLEVYE